MTRGWRLAVNAAFELIEAAGLVACLILVKPIMLFRHLNRLKKVGRNFRLLFSRGLVASAMRVVIDRALGNNELAAGTLSHLLNQLERETIPTDLQDPMHGMMTDFYTALVRLYLAAGRIDDATHAIVRATHHLKTEMLPDFPDFNVRIAHIVKAGIAAGKLLEEGGLATLMVKHGAEPVVGAPAQTPPRPRPSRRKPLEKISPQSDESKRGVVIPFPELPLH